LGCTGPGPVRRHAFGHITRGPEVGLDGEGRYDSLERRTFPTSTDQKDAGNVSSMMLLSTVLAELAKSYSRFLRMSNSAILQGLESGSGLFVPGAHDPGRA
jgi:hypothetical protein